MGEFIGIARVLAETLEKMKRKNETGEITPKDIKRENIPGVIGESYGRGRPINFYPYGTPGYGCCELALFLSLQTSAYIKRGSRGHMNCGQAIQRIVQHMQGICMDKTKHAVLVTDNWDGDSYEFWSRNFNNISQHALIEVYLLAGKGVSEIEVR